MKLFLGKDEKTSDCKHKHGFVWGYQSIQLGKLRFFYSNLSVVADSWTFLFNMLIFGGFFITYKDKDGSNIMNLAFQIQVGLFYAVNILSSIYNYIDCRFIVKFQKASWFMTWCSFFWFLYWVNQAVSYWYTESEEYNKWNGYYDVFVGYVYILACMAAYRKKRVMRHQEKRNVQFLGNFASDYYCNFQVVHWKLLVILFN